VLADIESTGDLKPAGVAANDLLLRTQDECQDNQQASEASSESTREIVINLDVPRKVSKHESGTYKPPGDANQTLLPRDCEHDTFHATLGHVSFEIV
jgi:hypothetical protein